MLKVAGFGVLLKLSQSPGAAEEAGAIHTTKARILWEGLRKKTDDSSWNHETKHERCWIKLDFFVRLQRVILQWSEDATEGRNLMPNSRQIACRVSSAVAVASPINWGAKTPHVEYCDVLRPVSSPTPNIAFSQVPDNFCMGWQSQKARCLCVPMRAGFNPKDLAEALKTEACLEFSGYSPWWALWCLAISWQSNQHATQLFKDASWISLACGHDRVQRKPFR